MVPNTHNHWHQFLNPTEPCSCCCCMWAISISITRVQILLLLQLNLASAAVITFPSKYILQILQSQATHNPPPTFSPTLFRSRRKVLFFPQISGFPFTGHSKKTKPHMWVSEGSGNNKAGDVRCGAVGVVSGVRGSLCAYGYGGVALESQQGSLLQWRTFHHSRCRSSPHSLFPFGFWFRHIGFLFFCWCCRGQSRFVCFVASWNCLGGEAEGVWLRPYE